MRKKLGGLVMVAAIIGLGVHPYDTYGTLEPCGMLQGEVKVRLMDGRLDSLGDIPALLINDGDQLWCAKEFVIIHLP